MAHELVLVRHGVTEWSKSGQHTSFTDLPLLPEGFEAAKAAGARLSKWHFTHVFSSPRRRARETAELALPGQTPDISEDLAEWNYGDYEGITTAEIHKTAPGWSLWTDGGPNGESPDAVAARCDDFIAKVDAMEGDVVAFAHSHILRCVAARWLGHDVILGKSFMLDTSGVSVLGVDRGTRVIKLWNA